MTQRPFLRGMPINDFDMSVGGNQIGRVSDVRLPETYNRRDGHLDMPIHITNELHHEVARAMQSWQPMSLHCLIAHSLLVLRQAPLSMYEEGAIHLRDMPPFLFKQLLTAVECNSFRTTDILHGLNFNILGDTINISIEVRKSNPYDSKYTEQKQSEKPVKGKRRIDLE